MSQEKLIIIRTRAEMDALQEYLRDKDLVAFDTETTGVEKGSEIIGFSVCADVEVGYYVITAEWVVGTAEKPGHLRYLETKEGAPAFMRSLKGKKLIMQNAPFDCAQVADNYGVDLMPDVHTDTLVLGHLLNENRPNGLKERGVELWGEDAREEQMRMKESVYKNGGVLTKDCYELYKGDADLIAYYGAKDAILTMKVFLHDVPILFEEGLDTFFYEEESMPLLRGPTYDMNTTGLRVDSEKLAALKGSLEAECHEAKAFIYKEIDAHVKERYKGTSKSNTFNINATQQLAWLLFIKLGQEFGTLTDGGKDLCKALDMKLPYTNGARREFIRRVEEMKGTVWAEPAINPKTKKMGKPKKVGDPWQYMSCGKVALAKAALRYKWAEKLLEYRKNLKLLNTYVEGIQSRMKYGIIRPNFLQHGTTSGRYACRNPNFQNLPRDDKRVKACIVSRPGKVFVGADYAQLEPRVFASFSKDERLLRCFAEDDDFYSVVGQPVFGAFDATLKKDGSPNSFPVKYKKLRDLSKVLALATPYGTTAPQMSSEMAVKAGVVKSIQECQEIIDDYFRAYPSVHQLMLDSHTQAKTHGVVYNLFGRPRRIPAARDIPKLYGKNTPHAELPRAARNLLNLAMNHPIQSTGASLMNRAAIAFKSMCAALAADEPLWNEVRIVLQVHDELITEGPAALAEDMVVVLKDAMENSNTLPGVALIAEPTIATNLADLK